MAKRILVTGGCGFVGRHLINRLSNNQENQISIVDDYSTGLPPEAWPEHLKPASSVSIIKEDCITFFEKSDLAFDIVFHLAAVVEGRLTIEHNPLKVAKDLMIDAAMFRWAVRTHPQKIVYFSSSAAYPIALQTRESHAALKEEMLDFRNGVLGVPDMSYGWSKSTGEFLSYLAVEKHGLDVAIYRPFSGYGEDQAMSYPFPSIMKRVLDNTTGTIEVWGSGEQSRDFIYIEDCITGILSTYEGIHDASALNLGSGIRTTFRELITMAASSMGKTVKVQSLLDKPEGVFARYCDTSKQKAAGFSPKYSIPDGINIVMEYLSHKRR